VKLHFQFKFSRSPAALQALFTLNIAGSTKANCFPSGQPGQFAGLPTDALFIGHVAAEDHPSGIA
jgi:hypothetical protein